MEIINAGTNPDGTPHLLYHAPGEHVVITPHEVSGNVTLPDGTEVNVTNRVIVVESQEVAVEVAAAIEEQHLGVEDASATRALLDDVGV